MGDIAPLEECTFLNADACVVLRQEMSMAIIIHYSNMKYYLQGHSLGFSPCNFVMHSGSSY